MTASVLTSLRARGHRITNARKAISECFAHGCRPLSAQEVHAQLRKKHFEVNPTTVYRELQFLAEEDVLRPLQFLDGVQRYETAALPHHHHLVCLSCNTVEDIAMEDDLEGMEKTIRKTKKFTVLRHALEFYGTCKKCQ